MRRCVLLYSTIAILLALSTVAQEQKKTMPMTASGRLAAARTVYLKNAGGTAIPFNVVESAVEGWGRFAPVDSPAKADLIIEVSAPDEGGGVSMSSSTSHSPLAGGEQRSTTSTRNISASQVKMVVLDGKSKAVLWSAVEKPKFAMKQKAKEDNLVEAAQRLVTKFRERVETALAQ